MYFVGYTKGCRVRIIGKGQLESIVWCGGFCPGGEWPTDSTRLKLANKSGFGSGNVALALEGNRTEPRASWIGDTDGSPLVTCLEGVFAGLSIRFGGYALRVVSQGLTCGEPKVHSQEGSLDTKVYIYAYTYMCA